MESQQETGNLSRLKLFAAIFLDGELGGGPLEGLNLAMVSDNIIPFLEHIKNQANYTTKYDLSRESIETMDHHLKQISTIQQYLLSHDTDDSAQSIFDAFEKKHDIFFPGGWTASPSGHAMIYRLFQDLNGDIIFLSFNTGAGAHYHKQISPTHLSTIAPENYKEKFNPVYAIRFKNDEKITQFGGLTAWIKKLVEPIVLPLQDLTYLDNNAEGIYEKIFAASAYLGGEVIDPTPYYSHITAGQRSGTCAQQAIQKMLRSFFNADAGYDRFILDYRLYVLRDVVNTQQIPQTYPKEFHAAVANTARMITTGKALEQQLDLDYKNAILDKLTEIKQDADKLFTGKHQPDEHVEPNEIVDAGIHMNPLSWMPGDTPKQDQARNTTPLTPLLLFDKTGSLMDALHALNEESKKSNKRIFVHNIERLCFTYCDKLKDFKSRPVEQRYTIEDWAQAITLLHEYSIEYFDFYFKNKNIDVYPDIGRTKNALSIFNNQLKII